MKETFSNHWGKAFTLDEAWEKKRKVDDAYAVYSPTSKWKPAELEADPRGGFRVVIETK